MRTIKINDQEYNALADWATVESFCIKKGIDLDEWNDFVAGTLKVKKGKVLQSYADYVLFLMCALERGAEESETPLDIKRNTVYNWFMKGSSTVIIGELIRDAYGNMAGDKLKNPEAPQKEEQ